MHRKHYPLTKAGISEIPTGVSGCYVIYFASFPAKFYIGSSKSLRSRLQAHRRNLEQNKHKNKQLRVLYSRFPHECRFAIVFEGDEKAARSYEQCHIDFNMPNLYNTDNKVVNYKRRK